jgi:predicted DNA-binding WGR domain protein
MQIPALEDKPSRYYQLLLLEDMLDGWTLVREWGQQGRSGRVKRDHFENYDAAQNALLRVRDSQLNRGFKVVFMQGQNPSSV